MTHVIYTGLNHSSLKNIRGNSPVAENIYKELPENNLVHDLKNFVHQSDAIVIGEQAGNPIKIAQMAYAIDSYISILILNDEPNHHKIKQALLFTPFIGNTVRCVSNSAGEGLGSVLADAIARTHQRRSYARLKGVTTVNQPFGSLYESVKNEYLDMFMEEAPIGALLLSREGVIMAINRQATLILNTTEKETLSTPFIKIFEGSQRLAVQEFIEEKFRQEPTRTFERTLHLNKQYLELRISEINATNDIVFKIAILNDISDKVVAQQKNEQQLRDLEVINNSLKRANADLDTFVYTASHDLKAPIANIEGLVKVLEKRLGPVAKEHDKIFNMLHLSIDKFQNTIRDLSEVTQLQRSTLEEEVEVYIPEVITEVQILLKELIESSDSEIEVNCSCKVLYFSRSNFRSIVYNLLNNAIKYQSPDRKPRVKIESYYEDGNCVLSVQDNGLGIVKAQKEKIFSIFKRLHDHVEGSGLGLFIVKRIVDNSGGRIEVESEPGAGSTFKVYLPQHINKISP
jgi:PAS domain S-box-containing protein